MFPLVERHSQVNFRKTFFEEIAAYIILYLLTYAIIIDAPLCTHLCFPLLIQARPTMPPKFLYPPFHGEQLERPLILPSMPARLEKATSKLPYRQEGETFQRKCTHRAQQSLWLALFLWKE